MGQVSAEGAAKIQPRDELALGILLEAWGELYEIECPAHGWWRWRRRDGIGGTQTVPDPDTVQLGIRADHDFHPVRGVRR